MRTSTGLSFYTRVQGFKDLLSELVMMLLYLAFFMAFDTPKGQFLIKKILIGAYPL